jgi:hypothetical protein
VLAVAHRCANRVTFGVAHGVTNLCAQRYPNSVAHGSSEHVAYFGTDGEPVSGALGGTHCHTICLAICSTDCIPNAGTNSIAVCCTHSSSQRSSKLGAIRHSNSVTHCNTHSRTVGIAVGGSNSVTDISTHSYTDGIAISSTQCVTNAASNAAVQSRRNRQRRSRLRRTCDYANMLWQLCGRKLPSVLQHVSNTSTDGGAFCNTDCGSDQSSNSRSYGYTYRCADRRSDR